MSITRKPSLRGHRDFNRLWLGSTISTFGTVISSVALPLLAVYNLHASTFSVAILIGLEWVPTLLFGLLAGAWIDRRRRRRIMIWADLCASLLFFSVPIAAAFGWLSLTQLFIVALSSGFTTLLFQGAFSAYLPSILAKDQLILGNARLQGSQSVAQVTGPGIGGLLVQVAGAPLAIAVDAVSFLVSAISIGLIRTVEPPMPIIVTSEQPTLLEQIRQGLKYVRRDRILFVLTGTAALSNLFLTAYESLAVVFLSRTIGLNAGSVGILMAAGGIGGLIGATFASRLSARFGLARSLSFVLAATAPFGLLIPLTNVGMSIGFFVVGNVVLMAGIVVWNVTVISYRQTVCPPELLGRVTATMRVALLGAMPIGALLGGVFGEYLGVRATLWLAMGLNIIPVVWLLASGVSRRAEKHLT